MDEREHNEAVIWNDLLAFETARSRCPSCDMSLCRNHILLEAQTVCHSHRPAILCCAANSCRIDAAANHRSHGVYMIVHLRAMVSGSYFVREGESMVARIGEDC